MSLATASGWFFNCVLAMTWPSLEAAFTNQGAFSWYAGWNVVGFFLVLLLIPETKGKTLEELDVVFDVELGQLVAYGWAELGYFWTRFVGRREEAIRPKVPRLQTRGVGGVGNGEA
jgi:sugar transport protein